MPRGGRGFCGGCKQTKGSLREETALRAVIDRLAAVLLLIAVLAAFVAMATGCRTIVAGGTARHDVGAFHAEVPTPSGIVHIYDDRDAVATTQPSIETNTGQMPQLGAAKEGTIGSVSFQQVKARGMAGGFVLAALFAAVAAFAWFVLRRPLVAVVCLSLSVVALLFPIWLGIGAAVIAVGAVLYLTNGHFKRIVGSVTHAIDETLPPDVATQFKGALRQGQDKADVNLVAAAKPPGV